jgi:hypothetical protein
VGEDPAQEREGEAAPPREDELRARLLQQQQRGFFPPLQPSPGMLSPGLLPGSPLGAATVASGGASGGGDGGFGYTYAFAGSRAGEVSTPMLLEADGGASPAPSGFFASPAAAVFSPQQLAQQQQWLRAQRAYAQQGAGAGAGFGAGAGAGFGAQLLPLSPAATVGGASAASFAASASFFVPRAAAGAGAPAPQLPQALHRPGSTQLPPSPSASSVYTTRTAFTAASAPPPPLPGQYRPAAL